MAFLTIAGATVEVIAPADAPQDELIGSSTRAFAGGLRTSVRAVKRAWEFQTMPLDDATVAAIKSSIALGAFVNVAGDVIGSTVSCQVFVTHTSYLVNPPTGFLTQLTLSIREV